LHIKFTEGDFITLPLSISNISVTEGSQAFAIAKRIESQNASNGEEQRNIRCLPLTNVTL
jgi:hypothetical protein